MSSIPPLNPEVLLLLVNSYKDAAYMGERAVKYSECVIDILNKQLKAVDAKLTEVESALTEANSKCDRLERELVTARSQLSECASRAPLKYVESSMCSMDEFKKMKAKLENLQAAERARITNIPITNTTIASTPITNTPIISPVIARADLSTSTYEDNIAD